VDAEVEGRAAVRWADELVGRESLETRAAVEKNALVLFALFTALRERRATVPREVSIVDEGYDEKGNFAVGISLFISPVTRILPWYHFLDFW
jgi:hypothetical protein